jgi:EAL domain-containing protein (putative c-di-GMP-specific phosphodiesterase class I)
MGTRPDCRVIVNSVSALAAQLGIVTTAEGVETEEHLSQVRHAGCAEAQGYFFGRPMPGGSVHRWLEESGLLVTACTDLLEQQVSA